MSNYTLSVKPRQLFGRKVRSLRRTGIIPGNVFGNKTTSTAIQFDVKAFKTLYSKAGETALINLTIEGEKTPRPVLVSGYSVDPVSNALQHVDFHQVDLKQKVTATIPLKFVGEAPATESGFVVNTLKNEVEVEALPTDLPEHIEVDLSTMIAVGDTIHASDLKIDASKIDLQIDPTEVIVAVHEQAKEEEPVAVESAEGEVAADGDAKPAEGEAKADAKPEDKKEEK
ncbi:MAG: 50S ribosomal protein L25 [bacterium]